jgi:hypothetical protein
VQLRFLILHGCSFLRQFSKNVLRPFGGHGKLTLRNREDIPAVPDGRFRGF